MRSLAIKSPVESLSTRAILRPLKKALKAPNDYSEKLPELNYIASMGFTNLLYPWSLALSIVAINHLFVNESKKEERGVQLST